MEMISCRNCGKLRGHKRTIGVGTFLAVILTFGFWLFIIPCYPKRCINCGFRKSDSVPWYQTWRLPGLAFLVIAVIAIVSDKIGKPSQPIDSAIKEPSYNQPAKEDLDSASPVINSHTISDTMASEEDLPTYRLKPDRQTNNNDVESVRTIAGKWSRPTLLYSDEGAKVYMPFDDQLALGSSAPEQDWLNSSFRVLIFTNCAASTEQRSRAIYILKLAGVADAERLRYTEENVLIDTARFRYTISSRHSIDASGRVFAATPDGWQEIHDLTDPEYPVGRYITTEILSRLTGPQITALHSLGIESPDEKTVEQEWAHRLAQHFATVVNERTRARQTSSPDHAEN